MGRRFAAPPYNTRYALMPWAVAMCAVASCSAFSSSCVPGLRSKTTFFTVPENGYGALPS